MSIIRGRAAKITGKKVEVKKGVLPHRTKKHKSSLIHAKSAVIEITKEFDSSKDSKNSDFDIPIEYPKKGFKKPANNIYVEPRSIVRIKKNSPHGKDEAVVDKGFFAFLNDEDVSVSSNKKGKKKKF